MDKEDKVSVGKTWKKKFFIAFLSGFLALGGLMAAFGFTGTALAVPLGGIGDFYVKFDKLEGKGFQLLPHIGETGESNAEPMIRNKIDEVTITNLHIYKDMKMPGGQWVRIHIKASGPTKISGLIQDARMIDANLSFNELAIKEKNTNNFSQNWSQEAKTITITDAKLVTDYLFQNVVSLEGTKIYTEKIDQPDMTETPS